MLRHGKLNRAEWVKPTFEMVGIRQGGPAIRPACDAQRDRLEHVVCTPIDSILANRLPQRFANRMINDGVQPRRVGETRL
jgi:hypothetical protein